MTSSLDLSIHNIATNSSNDPKKVWNTVEEHINRLKRIESSLSIVQTPRYNEARLHAHIYKEGPLRGSSFVIPEHDIHPDAIHALIDQGAVPIAELKTNEDPLDLSTFINPWNKRHIAGGSAAAAISSGGAVFSICSDRQGELILSSNFCGTFGLRPTTSLSKFGWHARTVQDLAHIFSCATGTSLPEEPPPTSVWYLTDYSPYRLEQSIKNMMHVALKSLQMQTLCFPIDTPLFSQAFSIWASNWSPPTNYSPNHPTGLMAKMMFERLNHLDPTLGSQLKHIRNDIKEGLIQLLGEDGVLICPAYPRCVPELSKEHTPMDFVFSAFFCDLGLPALHVPMGFCTTGIPLGLQIIAAPKQEQHLFAVGQLLEEEFKGWTRSQPFSINMPFNP